jgi:hypothetical protein
MSDVICELCGGSGVLRNLATLSPADDEPCPCTYEVDSHDTAENTAE